MVESGEGFLHQKYPDLHKSDEVEHEQERKKKAGEEASQFPAKKNS
jgi:hypothetical protein